MTTLTATYRKNNGNPRLLLLLMGLMLVALTIPAVTTSTHAALHTEADMIRQCFRDGRIQQIWINSSGERLNCLVDLGDGRVGNEVLQFCRRAGWIEITSYIIGDATLAEAVRVLKAKGCQLIYP
jgi:hypothetical protein